MKAILRMVLYCKMSFNFGVAVDDAMRELQRQCVCYLIQSLI